MPADRAQAPDRLSVGARHERRLLRKGKLCLRKNCAACHRIAGIGVNVAPDISDSRTKKPEQLLADILQPNRAIDNNYLGYSVAAVRRHGADRQFSRLRRQLRSPCGSKGAKMPSFLAAKSMSCARAANR